MTDIIRELFLILNIKAEKYNIAYNYQIEQVYVKELKHIFPRQRILKYNNGKLEKKINLKGRENIINYLNNELKRYN